MRGGTPVTEMRWGPWEGMHASLQTSNTIQRGNKVFTIEAGQAGQARTLSVSSKSKPPTLKGAVCKCLVAVMLTNHMPEAIFTLDPGPTDTATV